MSNLSDEVYYSYDELHDKCIHLYYKLKHDNYVPTIIVAIARGGWFPARVLSTMYEYDNKQVFMYSTTLQSYTTDKQQQHFNEIQPLIIPRHIEHVLLVDDIADSGKTLKYMCQRLYHLGAINVKTATIFYKPTSVITPNYYVDNIDPKTWITFPYETIGN